MGNDEDGWDSSSTSGFYESSSEEEKEEEKKPDNKKKEPQRVQTEEKKEKTEPAVASPAASSGKTDIEKKENEEVVVPEQKEVAKSSLVATIIYSFDPASELKNGFGLFVGMSDPCQIYMHLDVALFCRSTFIHRGISNEQKQAKIEELQRKLQMCLGGINTIDHILWKNQP